MSELRDERWENVWARIGTPEGYIYESFEFATPIANDYVEFYIELVYDGRLYYSRQIAHKKTLEDLVIGNLWAYILNEMVRSIDDRMKEEGK